MQLIFLGLILLSDVTRVNLANDETKASLSVLILKNPQILIERMKPSMQRFEIVSSVVSSKIILKVAKLALQVFSNIGLIGPQSSTKM